jgi:hypothetical protein
LRSYQSRDIIHLVLSLQESALNQGYLLVRVTGAPVPAAVTRLIDYLVEPDTISLALARNICFLTGGYLRVVSTNELIFTIPVHFTERNLNGYQVVLDISSRALRQTLFGEILDMGASTSLMDQNQFSLLSDLGRSAARKVVITDLQSQFSNVVSIPQVTVIAVNVTRERNLTSSNIRRWDGQSKRALLDMLLNQTVT